MAECWRCHRALEEGFPTCTSCGAPAAGPKILSSTPAVAAPESVPSRPTVPRLKFVLAPVATPQSPPLGIPAPEPEQEKLADRLRRLGHALRSNLQASWLLGSMLALVLISGVFATARQESARVNAASMEQAKKLKLLVRAATPSFNVMTFAGATIQVEEAWLARVGRQEDGLLSRDIVPEPDGASRLYIKFRISGDAQSVGLFAGSPLEPLKTLTVDRAGQPTLLHYLDLASFDLRPQVIVIKSPSRPQAGSAKLVIQ